MAVNNMAASVLRRLKNQAKEEKISLFPNSFNRLTAFKTSALSLSYFIIQFFILDTWHLPFMHICIYDVRKIAIFLKLHTSRCLVFSSHIYYAEKGWQSMS